jgi:hypothetical protein
VARYNILNKGLTSISTNPGAPGAFSCPPEPPPWCIELEKWPYHTDEWKQWLSDTRAGKNSPLPAAE